MKISTLIISLFITAFTFSQVQSQANEYTGTSIEEYNYMTKGYESQLSSGLDMKKGYVFEDIGTINKKDYKFNFKVLIREAKNEMAGILIVAESDISGKTYYLAMPIKNDKLKLDFEDKLRYWDESMTTAYAQAISELFIITKISSYLETE